MNTQEKLTEIQVQFSTKSITYQEAFEKAAPIIEAFNQKSEYLAKKAKKRPMILSFEKIFGKENVLVR